mmetsp:Transcript_32027/g.76123  ORF Transcript_32027/g.76123 Transcript_32027/m.76123 type:complete len:294 (+) Transcript_32027:323-1204(+)
MPADCSIAFFRGSTARQTVSDSAVGPGTAAASRRKWAQRSARPSSGGTSAFVNGLWFLTPQLPRTAAGTCPLLHRGYKGLDLGKAAAARAESSRARRRSRLTPFGSPRGPRAMRPATLCCAASPPSTPHGSSAGTPSWSTASSGGRGSTCLLWAASPPCPSGQQPRSSTACARQQSGSRRPSAEGGATRRGVCYRPRPAPTTVRSRLMGSPPERRSPLRGCLAQVGSRRNCQGRPSRSTPGRTRDLPLGFASLSLRGTQWSGWRARCQRTPWTCGLLGPRPRTTSNCSSCTRR